MKKVLRLTESDLIKLVKRIVKEDVSSTPTTTQKTISLDCARKTADNIALTTQQVNKWCPKVIVKPSPQPTQSNPTQQLGTAI
jgi:hypothetical protein